MRDAIKGREQIAKQEAQAPVVPVPTSVAALRSAGVHSEATIDDGICLLRRQLAEAEQDARRYRWIAGHCRSTSEHWGGRWSIIVDGPAPKAHDSEDAFDAAIDAAMRLTRPAEES